MSKDTSMIVLRQGFRKLSYKGRRMRAFSYAWSLPVMCQRCRSRHSIRCSRKSHATRKPYGSVCYGGGIIRRSKFYIAGIEILDLNLYLITFIYELDPYREMQRLKMLFDLPTAAQKFAAFFS